MDGFVQNERLTSYPSGVNVNIALQSVKTEISWDRPICNALKKKMLFVRNRNWRTYVIIRSNKYNACGKLITKILGNNIT
jgi:hypothetical protein